MLTTLGTRIIDSALLQIGVPVIPNTERSLVQSAPTESAAFSLSSDDSSHIMTILRDTLYSDKVLAVLREYGANAWDAHRSVGKGDVPIKVTIPTYAEPTLKIRDYGPGLSVEDVLQVYTQYGKSTKRDTNSAVGMLGIGSKSGFAYSDSFTVISWFGGKKAVFLAVLDESNCGVMNVVHSEDCDPKETGIQIEIGVKPLDIDDFHDRAQSLFPHFTPHPNINIDLELPYNPTHLSSGYILLPNDDPTGEWHYRKWYVVMGCVPYAIDLSKIDGDGVLESTAYHIGGVVHVDIGDIEINASREEVKYSSHTTKILSEKINGLIDEMIVDVIDKANNQPDQWSKRLFLRAFKGLVDIPDLGDLFANSIRVTGDVKFKLPGRSSKAVEKISVRPETRIIIHDSGKAIGGYDLGAYHYISKGNEKDTLDAIRKLDIEGIPILRTSDMEWVKAGHRSYSSRRVYWKGDAFILKRNPKFSRSGGRAYSDDWEPCTEEPPPGSLRVNISRYEAVGSTYFRCAILLQRMCEALGEDFPTVVGYKKNPDESIREFDDWAKERLEAWSKTQVVNDAIDYRHILKVSDRSGAHVTRGWYERAKKDLNDGSLFLSALDMVHEFRKSKDLARLDGLITSINNMVAWNGTQILRKLKGPSFQSMMDQVYKAYPMLSLDDYNPINRFVSAQKDTRKVLLDYINLMDATRAKEPGE